MTIERAIRLAENFSSGGVCTLRDGEAQEYHRLFLSMLLSKQDVVRCVECKHLEKDDGLEYGRMCLVRGSSAYCRDNDFCSYGEPKEGVGNG